MCFYRAFSPPVCLTVRFLAAKEKAPDISGAFFFIRICLHLALGRLIIRDRCIRVIGGRRIYRVLGRAHRLVIHILGGVYLVLGKAGGLGIGVLQSGGLIRGALGYILLESLGLFLHSLYFLGGLGFGFSYFSFGFSCFCFGGFAGLGLLGGGFFFSRLDFCRNIRRRYGGGCGYFFRFFS